MFNAKFVKAYQHNTPLTKGRTYEVIDFNDYFGTYYIMNDNGERAAISWDRFEDGGRAATAYQQERAA